MRSVLTKEVLLFIALIALLPQTLNCRRRIRDANTASTEPAEQVDLTNFEQFKTNEEVLAKMATMHDEAPYNPAAEPDSRQTEEQDENTKQTATGFYNRVEREIVVPVVETVETPKGGFYDRVEKSITAQAIDTTAAIVRRDINYRLTTLGVLLFLSASLAVFGAVVLLLSSAYYRVYVERNKCAPFEVPSTLRAFFPQPVNYEYEINSLCSKYLDN